MARRIQFTVPGIPMAKKRHRTVPMLECLACQKKIQGQYRECPECSGALRFVTNLSYSDSESVKYENLIAYCARQALGSDGMFTSPVRMVMCFTFPIPESRQCKKQEHVPSFWTEVSGGDPLKAIRMIHEARNGCKKLHPGNPHSQRPDVDNLSKSLDGLIGVLFADDSIISVLEARKVWGTAGQAEFLIEELA